MEERLQKQLAFCLEVDKAKNIFRQTHLSNHGRNENDAEHSWHMALMAYLLREYSNGTVDIAKVMAMKMKSTTLILVVSHCSSTSSPKERKHKRRGRAFARVHTHKMRIS